MWSVVGSCLVGHPMRKIGNEGSTPAAGWKVAKTQNPRREEQGEKAWSVPAVKGCPSPGPMGDAGRGRVTVSLLKLGSEAWSCQVTPQQRGGCKLTQPGQSPS